MGFGLLGMGQQQQQTAMNGFGKVADLETRRNQANEQLERQYENAEQQQKGTMTASGALIGATYGSSLGPWGAVIGAGVGYLASELF